MTIAPVNEKTMGIKVPKEPNTDVKRYAISLCQACIDGVGEECHTPGCALYLHSVDIPIMREMLTEIDQRTFTDTEVQSLLRRIEEESVYSKDFGEKIIRTKDASSIFADYGITTLDTNRKEK